ncbi:MAG TPA: alkyl hydroperoxide reductase [Nitrolancea sp.]
MQLLPQLAEVERHFPEELVIIGVHSPKFPAERDGRSLRSAVQRNEVEHPVVNDADMTIWSSYAVRAWPTLMFLDPQGRVIGKHEGEAPADALIDTVAGLVERYDAEGLIDRKRIPGIERMALPDTPLTFPGKILTDEAGGRLFIADTGHNRIVVTKLDGSDPWVIGNGAVGLADGDFAEARFHNPEGMALDGETLYVADKSNHAIRRVDLKTRNVTTIAGTGELGMSYAQGGPARSIDLRSPWDLSLHGTTLYIAMAGMHQIWALDLTSGMLFPYAGTGHEDIRDRELDRARLAQTSGLDSDGKKLYFVDSETSSVRTADLPPFDQVHTIVGTGLFDFGDKDGVGEDVLLQHPLGLALGDEVLYLADSYNHKIKRVYPSERRVESWLGDGTPGDIDGTGSAARFHEPAGLALASGKLFIADTNSHLIRVADLATGDVSTLMIRL